MAAETLCKGVICSACDKRLSVRPVLEVGCEPHVSMDTEWGWKCSCCGAVLHYKELVPLRNPEGMAFLAQPSHLPIG